MKREVSLFIFLIFLAGLVSWFSPGFLSGQNFMDILVNSSYVVIAGVGMTLVIITGGIDISVGSVLAVCALVSASLAKTGLALFWVIILTLLLGAVIGWLNGILVAKVKIPAIIVTLGMLSVWRGLILWITKGYWISGLPSSYNFLGNGKILGLPVPVLVMFIVLAVAIYFSRYTVGGRQIYLVGNNEKAAVLDGLNIGKIKIFAYTVLGGLVGLATLVYATRFTVVQSNTGVGFELLVITAVLIGGTNILGGSGTVLGTFLGAILLTTIGTALTFLKISPYWEQSIQGGFILLAVVSNVLTGKK